MIVRYNVLTIIWAIFILVATLLPGHIIEKTTPWYILNMDKIVHMFIFLVLAALLTRGLVLQHSFPISKFSATIIAILFGVFYGWAIEIIQIYIPKRSFDYNDLFANTAGAILGAFLFLLVERMGIIKSLTHRKE